MQLASDVFSEYAHVKTLLLVDNLMEIPCDAVTWGSWKTGDNFTPDQI
jgi:hypothetical protein